MYSMEAIRGSSDQFMYTCIYLILVMSPRLIRLSPFSHGSLREHLTSGRYERSADSSQA